ncbi:hypothetical protein IW261DRAFT_1611402 [Armillaria novae-zelandiae]|uniref:F-box domain-containing protein n=1 Tax=Armillaria novae-zelandiae TaxID=153914 RepID=A0AA39NW63_9AGAR|nr:hypothetical protein IW261DRAFT_1611402 [Armillaria novae-zelandiae]
MPSPCLYCRLSASPSQYLHNGNIYQYFDNKLSPVDISLVKSVILSVEGNIQSIDHQLNLLEVLRSRLLAEQGHAAAELTKYHSLVAPVRQLPNEILFEIFSLTCANMPNSIDVIKGPPWVLTHVCSQWRSFCLSSPHLWSTVVIPPMNSKRYHVADILGSYLDRSHGLPLNICLDARASTKRVDVDRDGHCTSILHILRPHMARWHMLVLSCGNCPAILDIINIWEYRESRLTHLKKIDIRTEVPRLDPAYPISAFSRALNLENIHLRGGILLKNLSFPHLTSFLGAVSSIVQFRQLIESSPSLQDISIWYKPSIRPPDNFPPIPLTHPNIRKVTVYASTACFSSVIFPSLEELVIDSGVYESNFGPEHVNHLSSLMGSSNHPGRSLSMKVLSPSHITPFLTPGLTSLTIEVQAINSKEIYGALMYNPESSYPVAPNLTQLSIKEMSPVSNPVILTDDACLKMVLSRATTLQSVVLQIICISHYTQLKGARPHPLLNDFKSLRSSRGQDGLDVRIRWTGRIAILGTDHDKVLDLI